MVKIALEFSAFVHSTEDEKKVLNSLLNVLPLHLRQVFQQRVRAQSLEGYYGNAIKLLRLSIGRDAAEGVLRHILCGMSKTDREVLLATLESRVESRRSRVHFRLSKQDLYLGRVVLSEGNDVVKIVASFEGVRQDGLREVLRKLGEACGG